MAHCIQQSVWNDGYKDAVCKKPYKNPYAEATQWNFHRIYFEGYNVGKRSWFKFLQRVWFGY